MVLGHGQSNPRGQPGRGAAHAVNRHAELRDRPPPSRPRAGSSVPSRTGGGCPQSPPGPRDPLMLGSEQIYCMLSWPKLHGKRGTAGWGDDTEGGEGKFLEVPWPQVTASELRPEDLHTFSAGGRGSRQGHKRQ